MTLLITSLKTPAGLQTVLLIIKVIKNSQFLRGNVKTKPQKNESGQACPIPRSTLFTFCAGNWKRILRSETPKQYNQMLFQGRDKHFLTDVDSTTERYLWALCRPQRHWFSDSRLQGLHIICRIKQDNFPLCLCTWHFVFHFLAFPFASSFPPYPSLSPLHCLPFFLVDRDNIYLPLCHHTLPVLHLSST